MRTALSRILGLLAALLLVALTACSEHHNSIDDPTTAVAEDDAEMNAAIAKGRDTLPQFWEVFAKPDAGDYGFSLKVKITDPHGAEYFWVNALERHDGKLTGVINNDPDTVTSVKLGDKIEIREADIRDWLYMRGGKMVGNRTLRPLLKHMKPAETEGYRKMMADP
jgi:uncharacterized protein YegJ (DUF2314 family)